VTSSPADSAGAGARLRILISGRVQGVAFRAYTQEEASGLALSGWVRNLRDGRVEVLAEGPRDALEKLLAWCREGPAYANVTGVDVEWQDPRGDLGDFHIAR
jgi:acylphosphatase